MVVWFAVLAGVAIINVFAAPATLAALNPFQGLAFCLHHGSLAFVALGVSSHYSRTARWEVCLC